MQPRLRYAIRLFSTFFARFKGLILLGLILGVIIFFLFGFLIPKLIKPTQRIGISGRYRVNNLPSEIIEKIGDGLTFVNSKNEVEPNLAESWETTDKGKTWIFKLKGDVKWQDGSKLTSKDINYSFSDVTIEKPSPDKIIFKLKNEYSPFPFIVSAPVFKKGLLGTGDWSVKRITTISEFVQSLTIEDKSGRRIVYKIYPTEERLKLAFKLGQIDTIKNIFNPLPLTNWRVVNTEKSTDFNKIVTIFFNTTDTRLAEKTLRQALVYAIDKDALGGLRAISPINPNSWGYNPQVKPYNFDKAKALEIIKDLPKEVKENLSVKLATTPVLLPIAEKIVQNWKDVGIKAEVLVSSIQPSEFQAYLAIFEIPSDPDQYPIWHSTQGATNISNYSSPRIDKLLEDGRLEIDIEKRRAIYLDFQRFLVEDVPAAFLYHPEVYEIARK